MDDAVQIDIKKIIQFLLERWIWIILPVFVIMIATFIYLSNKPTTYTAVATTAITRPKSLTNVNKDFETIIDTSQQPYRAYLDLATNSETVEELYTYWNDLNNEENLPLKTFKPHLEADLGNDNNILILRVSLFNAENAEKIANYWAELFVHKINSLFYGKNEDQLKYFAEQVAISKVDWNISNQALIEFNRQNSISSVSNQLNSLLDQQNELLSQQRKNKRTVNDIQILINIISNSQNETTTFTDQISALLLQVNLQTTYSGSEDSQILNPSTVQLQLTENTNLNFSDKDELLAYLKNLSVVLDKNWTNLQLALETLEPQILALQEKHTQLIVQREALEQDQTLAKETYQSLKIKYEETRINNESDLGGVQIAARATRPLRVDSKHTVTYLVSAGSVSGLVTVIIVLIIGWWNNAFDFAKKPEEVEQED